LNKSERKFKVSEERCIMRKFITENLKGQLGGKGSLGRPKHKRGDYINVILRP
jgi:hypothetical protein